MKYVIKEGKSVEEAIDSALLELDANNDEVEVEVLEESSKGFLGLIGTKDARVKVSIIKDLEAIAREFLNQILNYMNIEANIDIERKEDSISIDINNIKSRDKGIIIGKRGNTLDAIQYLLSLHINKDNEDYTRMIIDVEGYRDKREQTLIRLAKKMGEKAIQGGRPVKLEPMNPYERRIIHSNLQNYEGVTTYSEGKDPYRRVVIKKE